MTPLFIAAQKGHVEVATVLLDRNADVNLAMNVSCHCFVVLRLSN